MYSFHALLVLHEGLLLTAHRTSLLFCTITPCPNANPTMLVRSAKVHRFRTRIESKLAALLLVSREQVRLDSEHLAANTGSEAVYLSGVLLHLPAVEQSLQSAGLLGQLEQSLPLVLGKRWLFRDCALSILGFPLLLPLRNLSLLACQRSLVVLVVVEFSVMVLYAVEEEIAGLLKERIDRKVQGVKVWRKRHGEVAPGVLF